MTDEAPGRVVRRVRDEDLEGWQRDLVEESRRRTREEQTFADDARREAAARRGRPDDGLSPGSDPREDG